MDPTCIGLNIQRGQWPTPAALRAIEAAGFGAVQIHTPPRAVLAVAERCRRHARALRQALRGCEMRLVLHGPDSLSLGAPDHDRAFDGLLSYAAETEAAAVVYHGLNHADPGERAQREEASLAAFAARAEALGVTVAVENLAPVWPGGFALCHEPPAVRDLVRRVASPAIGMLLDLGHAHITTSLAGGDLPATVEAVLADVVLLHVHDNLGARRHDLDAPGLDPLKLDLHLPPGAGTLPWHRVAPLLRGHRAIAMLEIEGSRAADPGRLRRAAQARLRGEIAHVR